MRPVQTQLIESVFAAFPAGGESCLMSLKQADEVDTSYAVSSLDDIRPADWRSVADAELENFHWGLAHLDAQSWRFYLPVFLVYSIRHASSGGSLVVNACVQSLRPPDRVPPRLSVLAPRQRKAVVATLEFLAFDPQSGFKEDADKALREYWVDNP